MLNILMIEDDSTIAFGVKYALEQEGFNIDICKDCELRYACSDCRAYRVAESMVSKPLKCSYKNKLI